MKIDKNGISKFGKTYKTMPKSAAKDLKIYPDSSIVLAGYCIFPFSAESDAWIIRLNKHGEKLWYKNFGDKKDEIANSVIISSDNNIVAAGMTQNVEMLDKDAYIIKVSPQGELLWEKTLGGAEEDYANCIIETNAGNLVMCGTTTSQGDAHSSIWVVKLDSEGEEIWNYTFDSNEWNYGTSLVQAPDSCIYVAGYTQTFSQIDYDVVLLKLDTDGKLIWKKHLSWGRWDQATSISNTFDNAIIVGGFSRSGKENSSNFALGKFNLEGELLWKSTFERKSLDYANKVIPMRDKGFAVVGTSYMQGNGWDFAVLKYVKNNRASILFKEDSIMSTTEQLYNLDLCISAETELKNIQLFFNNVLYQDSISRQPATDSISSDCDIPLKFEINLQKGLNNIEIVITDVEDYEIRKTRKIYFLPSIEESW